MPKRASYGGRHDSRGLTLLELMIVIAILGFALVALSRSIGILGTFGLTEDSDELSAMLRRASQLAIERGEQHRVVFDLDKGAYRVDVCTGAATLSRNEQTDPDKEKVEQAVQKGQDRLRDLPTDALASEGGGGGAEDAVTRAKALAGHHVGDRMCTPAQGGTSAVNHSTIKKNLTIGDESADWIRALDRKVKFNEIWVQHKDGSTKKGDVAIYFFPNGSAEKAVIELSDGESYRTVLVSGLTGQIQQKVGKLDDPDTHMLRNVMGDKDKQREADK